MTSTWKTQGNISSTNNLLSVNFNSIITKSIIITDNFKIQDIVVNGNLFAKSVDVSMNLTTRGNMYGLQNLYVSKDVSLNNLYVCEDAYLNNKLFFGTLVPNTGQHSFFYGNSIIGKFGINTVNPTTVLDITGQVDVSNILTVRSNSASIRNILAQNNTNNGVTISANLSTASVSFFPNGDITNNVSPVSTLCASGDVLTLSATNAAVSSTNITEIYSANYTKFSSKVSFSTRNTYGSVVNETVSIYDTSSTPLLDKYYQKTTAKTGNALSLIGVDTSSTTFLNLITPNKKGLSIGGGSFVDPGSSRSMGLLGLTDVSGTFMPSQVIVSGNDTSKYRSTTGFNTFSPKTEQYVVDVNGPMRIGNGEINITNSADFEIKHSVFNRLYPNFGIVLGSPSATSDPFIQYISLTTDGGATWKTSPFEPGSGIENVSIMLTAYICDQNTIFLCSQNSNFFYYTRNAGISWNLLQPQIPFVNATTFNTIFGIQTGDEFTAVIGGTLNAANTIFIYNTITLNNSEILDNSTLATIPTSLTLSAVDGSGSVVYFVGNGIQKYDFSNYSLLPSNGLLYTVNTLYQYNDVYLLDELHVVAVGNGIISYTTNGTDWTNVSTVVGYNTSFVLNSVFVYDLSKAVAVGNNGLLVYTTNGYATWNVVPSSILNSSGIQNRINGPNQILKTVHMPNINSLLITDVIDAYGGVYAPHSSCIYGFFPALFNSVSNTVLDVSGNMNITGDILFSGPGNTKISSHGGLTIDDDLIVSKRLIVLSKSYMDDDLGIRGNLNITQNINLDNNLFTRGYMVVMGDAYLYSRIFVSGDVVCNNNLMVDDNTLLNRQLVVGEDAFIKAKLVVNQDAFVRNRLFVSNDLFSSRLIVYNDTSFNSGVTTPYVTFQDGSILSNTTQYDVSYLLISISNTNTTTNTGVFSPNMNLGDNQWKAFAASQNNQYQTVVHTNGFIYASSNYGLGAPWVPVVYDIYRQWISVCMSLTGQFQYAIYANSSAPGSMFDFFMSSSYGLAGSWTQVNTPIVFDTPLNDNDIITTSANGQYVFFTHNSGCVYSSTNYGATWDASFCFEYECSTINVACSANGQYVSIAMNDSIYSSSTFGSNDGWTKKNIQQLTRNITISNTGQFQYVSLNQGQSIYLSSNYGSSWTPSSVPAVVNSIVSSDTGEIVAIASNSTVFISNRYGITGSFYPVFTIGIGSGDNRSISSVYLIGQYCYISVFDTVSRFYSTSIPTLHQSFSKPFLNSPLIANPRFTNDLSFNNRLFVSGNTEINADLYIEGNTIVNSNLIIMNETFLNHDLNMSGNLNINENVNSNGNFFVNGFFALLDDAFLHSRLLVYEDTFLLSRLCVNYDTLFKERLFVGGDAFFKSRLIVDDEAFIGANLTVQNHTYLNNRLTVIGEVDINSDVSVDGNAIINSQLLVMENAFIIGNTYVNQDLNINGNVNINENINLVGNIFITGNLVINKQFYVDVIETTTYYHGYNTINSGSIFINNNFSSSLPNRTVNDTYSDGVGLFIYDNSNTKIGGIVVSKNNSGYNFNTPHGTNTVKMDVSQMNTPGLLVLKNNGDPYDASYGIVVNPYSYFDNTNNLQIANSLGIGLISPGTITSTVRLDVNGNALVRGSLIVNNNLSANRVVPYDISLNNNLFVGNSISFVNNNLNSSFRFLNAVNAVIPGSTNTYNYKNVVGGTGTPALLIASYNSNTSNTPLLYPDIILHSSSNIFIDAATYSMSQVNPVTCNSTVLQPRGGSVGIGIVSPTNALDISGVLNVSNGDVFIQKSLFVNDVSINSRLFVLGNTELRALSVSTNAFIKSLDVSGINGSSRFYSPVFLYADTNVNSRLFINNIVFDTSLSVYGPNTHFYSNLITNANLLVNGGSSFTNDVSITRRLNVVGDASFGNRLVVASDLSINGFLYANFKNNSIPNSAIINGLNSTGIQTILEDKTFTDTLNYSVLTANDGSILTSTMENTDITLFAKDWNSKNVLSYPIRSNALSTTGKYMCMGTSGGPLLVSSDCGNTWIPAVAVTTPCKWVSVSVSQNGKYQLAVAVSLSTNLLLNLYSSAAYGEPGSWNTVSFSTLSFTNVDPSFNTSISTTGKYQLFSIANSLFLSSNYGANGSWTTPLPSISSSTIFACNMSYDGKYMVACDLSAIYISNAYGALASWTRTPTITSSPTNTTIKSISSFAISSTGQYMSFSFNGLGHIYTSADFGATWTLSTLSLQTIYFYTSISVSATGQFQVATTDKNHIFFNTQFGISGDWRKLTDIYLSNRLTSTVNAFFNQTNSATTFNTVSISANGKYILYTPSTVSTYLSSLDLSSNSVVISILPETSASIGYNGIRNFGDVNTFGNVVVGKSMIVGGDVSFNGNLVVSNKVFAQGYSYLSDVRVKRNIEDIDGPGALDVLRSIQPRRFDFIDGSFSTLGFIAQEVREVLPETVSLRTNFIPNIYAFADVSGARISIHLLEGTVCVGDCVKFMLDCGASVVRRVVCVVDDECFVVDAAFDADVRRVFVYGKEVADLHTINQNDIYTLTCAAVKSLDQEVTHLKHLLAEQGATIRELVADVNVLMRR